MACPVSQGRLCRGERLLLWALLGLVVIFGCVTFVRMNFLSRRMGDLEVYLRASWAAREGGEAIYTATSSSGLHYVYPPLLAILLAPLADPPPDAAPMLTTPYWASTVVWYLLSIGCLAVGVHALARALESRLPHPTAVGSRRWWVLRVWPVAVVLIDVGSALSKGQVTLLWLALTCGFLAALIHGRSIQAGILLAATICLKVIPGFLVLVPLWRRDLRCLASCAAGLVIGLAAIPAAVFGPERTVQLYHEFADVVLAPGLGVGDDQRVADELTGMNATDNQALQAVLHNWLHPDRATRPDQPARGVRLAHWLLGGALTLATLLTFGRRANSRADEALRLTLLTGSLTAVLLLVSPVTHLFYFPLLIPLVMGLLASEREAPFPRKALACALAVYFVASLAPRLPGFSVLREVGVLPLATLLLWGFACRALRETRRQADEPLRLAA